jgi:hypothetical protein
MYKLWLVFILFHSTGALAQSAAASYFDLSGPEKFWVITHFLKAKKAFEITGEVLKTTDSVSKTGLLEPDLNGGQLDAFKHGFWMASLTRSIGKKAALKLGEAHEKGNYQDFKNRRKEDGMVPDKMASEMDLFNNRMGADLALDSPPESAGELVNIIADAIKSGRLKILKKDNRGNFLDCQGNVLSGEALSGKWETAKCLVDSDE